MGAIRVKHFPEDLHARLRARAASQGCDVSAYVTGVLERDLCLPSTREWFDGASKDLETDIASERIMNSIHEAREERIEQILRAVMGRD